MPSLQSETELLNGAERFSPDRGFYGSRVYNGTADPQFDVVTAALSSILMPRNGRETVSLPIQ